MGFVLFLCACVVWGVAELVVCVSSVVLSGGGLVGCRFESIVNVKCEE